MHGPNKCSMKYMICLLISEPRKSKLIFPAFLLSGGPQAPTWVGWIWFLVAAIGIAYPGLLVFFGSMRLQALLMTLFTVVGFEVRRRSGLRWALVTLTFEGALRIGLIAQMLGLWYVYGSPRLPGMGRYWG